MLSIFFNFGRNLSLSSIAFCSISTGLYGYPIEEASKVAIRAVNEYLKHHPNTSIQKVIFDVFSKGDYEVYEREINRTNE